MFFVLGNKVERMKSKSLNIESLNFTITNNIIHHMDEEAISELRAKQAKPFENYSNRIYNFSNNQIHILDKESLTLPKMKSDAFFHSLIIFNNSINCSCQNINWFKYIAENKSEKEHLCNVWTKKSNQNKCLNIENCSINQALLNFYEFCEYNYKCPVDIALQNSSFNLSNHVVNDSLYINFLDTMKIFIEQQKSNEKFTEEVKQFVSVFTNDSLDIRLRNKAINNTYENAMKSFMDKEENNEKLAEEVKKIISLLSMIAMSLVSFLIVVCLIGFYFLWTKLPKENCRKIKLLSSKSVETEMDAFPS